MSNLPMSRPSARSHRDYTPFSWTEYFHEAHDISTPPDTNSGGASNTTTEPQENSFRVYLANFHRPPYAPKREPGHRLDQSEAPELSAAELSQYSNIPTLVALHGGGYSGLTWAQFTRHIVNHCRCRVMAIDLRGHGDTKTLNDDRMDIDTLISDVVAVTHATHQICGFPETPKIVLIGHSMGGAIAVKCAAQCGESLPSLAGFVIIDVVEGTAKEALPLMLSVIKTRPAKFPSLSNAIEWTVRSGMAKNSDAARVSMPGNLVNIANGRLAIHDVPITEGTTTNAMTNPKIKQHKFHVSLEQLIGQSSPAALLPRPALPLPARVSLLKGESGATMSLPSVSTLAADSSVSTEQGGAIREEEEEITDVVDHQQTGESNHHHSGSEPSKPPIGCGGGAAVMTNDGYKKPPEIDASGYAWRTNLAKTQPYWNGWFDGLSNQLLAAPVQGKFLLLAGIDRLDRTLTIGHMQGKFMMKVLPKCGHAVHEDVPEQVASTIGDFLVRNKFAVACGEESPPQDS